MRLTTIIILATLLQVSAATFGQRVTIKRNNITLDKLFKEIRKQTGYDVLVASKNIHNTATIDVNFQNTPLKEALSQILEGRNLTYTIEDKSIVIKLPEQSNISFSSETMVADIVVKGKVTDAKGPLPGVTVTVEGTKTGTATDGEGNYSIKVPEKGILVFSLLGYEVQKIPASAGLLNVALLQSTTGLEEVLVVGYGTQKKVNLTGAIASIKGDVLQNRPVNNIAQGLQGAVSNLTITPSSGNPAANQSIKIRGTSSINVDVNSAGPLVLVDGVEMNMNLVNPNDVESITVLKDAASAAIYGVRAAYGVVLITTKTAGKTGKTSVSYNNNFGFSEPSVFPEMVGKSYVHAEFINKAMANAGLAAMYTDRDVAGMKAYDSDPVNNPLYEIVGGEYRFYGYNDWKQMLLRDLSPSQRHNLSISGGTEKTRFFSSIGYTDQEGLLKVNPDKFKRLNTRISVENNTTDWLKLGMKALYNHTLNNEPYNYGNSTWHQFVFTSPVRPFRWDGNTANPEYSKYEGMYFNDQNPMALLEKGGRNNLVNDDVWLTASADLKFLKGWTGHVDYNYNLNFDNSTYQRKRVDMITSRFIPTDGDTKNNEYKVSNAKRDYYSVNAYTQYENTFGKHYFKAMAGFNQELTTYKYSDAIRKTLLNQEVPSLSLGSGLQTISDTGYEWALRGGFFRLNYIYNDRYLLEVNGRYDGTSRFPDGNRHVFLPSVSAGWRVSEEGFMGWSKSFLDNLKIRGSYGALGNQLLSARSWAGNTKYYPYIPFMSSGLSSNYIFGNQQEVVINPPTLVSNSLTWEKAATLDFGVDASMFSSKLDFVFDWYQRTTSDMLTSVVYPELLGATSPAENLAQLRTRGWEMSLTWKDKINDFGYDLGVVLGDSQAEITKFPNETGSLSNYYVGQKVGEIWGYTTEGLFQTAAEVTAHASQAKLGNNWAMGDVKYKDTNGDGEVSPGSNTLSDPGDRSVIGNSTPRYTYGITANLRYKGFFMNIFAQGVGKADFWPSAQAFWPVSTQYFATQQWFVDDSWTPENPNAYFARPIARETKNQQQQTRYLQDASYLRLKNLTLGYNFNNNWLKKLKLSNAQVYLSGENLFYLSPIKGSYDPEAAGSGGGMIYPYQRTYSLGLSLGF